MSWSGRGVMIVRAIGVGAAVWMVGGVMAMGQGGGARLAPGGQAAAGSVTTALVTQAPAGLVTQAPAGRWAIVMHGGAG